VQETTTTFWYSR